MQYGEETTYHCRLSHSQTIEDLFMESLDQVVDAEESQLNLQASVKREKLELVLMSRIDRFSLGPIGGGFQGGCDGSRGEQGSSQRY